MLAFRGLIRCFPVLWILIAPLGAQAQSGMVRGFASDAASGEFLIGVNVILVDDDGSIFGSASNSDGFFAVGGLDAGQYALEATYVGYSAFTDTLIVNGGEILRLDFAMTPTVQRLSGLEVIGQEEGSLADLVAGMERIQPADIERVPGPDVSGDVATYLATLPGVVLIGDQGGQFYVRGGEPTQNLSLIDGMIVYQPFHILSYYMAFSPEILRSVDLHAGGFDARFGGRISSVIDAWSRNGNSRRFAASAQVSPFVVGTQLEGPLGSNNNFSFLTSVRQSALEQGASLLIPQEVPLNFHDIFAKIQGKTHRHGRIAFSMLRTSDRGRIGSDTGRGQTEEVGWTNHAIGMRYLFLPGNLPILAEFLVSLSDHENTLGEGTETARTSSTGSLNIEANITHYTPYTNIRWGVFARSLSFVSDLSGLFQTRDSPTEYVIEAGLYLSPYFQLSDGSYIAPSLRVQNFPSKGAVYIEPRLRGQWQKGGNTLMGAIGLYHQEIVGLNDRRDAASVFTAWTASPTGQGVPRAWHVIMGYRRSLPFGTELAAEVYYKELESLYIAEWTPRPRLTTALQQGQGRALGLDLRLEIQHPRFYGSINYGLASVKYEAMQPELEVWFGTPSYSFRPAHDRRHQLNVLVSAEVATMVTSVLWQFGSGRPYSRALGYDGFLLLDGRVDVFTEPGERRVIYDRPFNGVLPAYHRLDVSVEKSFRLGNSEITAQLSLINAYDRSNIFYLDIFTLQRADQLPLIPSLGLKASF